MSKNITNAFSVLGIDISTGGRDYIPQYITVNYLTNELNLIYKGVPNSGDTFYYHSQVCHHSHSNPIR